MRFAKPHCVLCCQIVVEDGLNFVSPSSFDRLRTGSNLSPQGRGISVIPPSREGIKGRGILFRGSGRQGMGLTMIVCSLAGPTETRLTGQPMSSSSFFT